MEPEEIMNEEPYARKVVGVVQKTRRRWLVVLECGHTVQVLAQSILKLPEVFYCSSCRDKKAQK